MKNKILALLVFLLTLPSAVMADNFVNLTPRPKSMSVGSGTLTLPSSFTISHSGLSEEMTAEVNRLAEELRHVTGYNITVAENDDAALIRFQKAPSKQKEGGYNMSVNDNGVRILTTETLGTYYACQTLKKIMPACVMAGVKDARVKTFDVPYVSIVDEPRFAYRGFMLDVARHFFTVDEVKRMLDVMAYYKLNRFHWHLSDDQGWRVEIKKYPRLTQIGSVAPNCRFTDMADCSQYWTNKPYGPYFYTQDEIRDVVSYARERHIEIIPEIDMPGHFCAALASYPEFSCSPLAGHAVMTDGGIFNDVMNVANPKAVEFTKDILAELIELFPYDYIHIGGDECPTTLWENNAECQALYKKLGLTSYRQLQSRFIEQLGEFVKAKGKKLAVWNEAISAGGADVNLIKKTGATVFCWTGPEAAVKAAKKLGLPRVYTPWGPYYINRRQGNSPLDPPGAGDGSDNVKKTYNTTPPAETDLGVQGTFWTEHVSDAAYMEWLALPRLLAIAEAGWTQQSRKNFADFQKRMSADTTLLNYGNYRYCKYHMLDAQPGEEVMVMPKVSTNGSTHYYRLISGATDARKDRCIELLQEGSPLISEQAGKGAKANVLWTNTQAAEKADNYDAQWWRLEEDAAHPGCYALVCKASPDGSVNPAPTQTDNAGRWTYDASAKHYCFVLGSAAYGSKGTNHFYSIMSNELEGKYLNSSMAGQGMAVNVYTDPTSGGGGQWEFQPEEAGEQPGGSGATENPEWLVEGKTYTFANAVEGFHATALTSTSSSTLTHSTEPFTSTAWTVTKSTKNADGTQTIRLKNAKGLGIGASTSFTERTGWAVTLGKSGAKDIVVKYVAADKAYRLLIDGHSLYAHPSGRVYAGSTIANTAYDAPRGLGAEWTFSETTDWTFVCTDEEGNELGSYVRSLPATTTEVTPDLCPALANRKVEKLEKTDGKTVRVSYKRTAYAITYRCIDPHGNVIKEQTTTLPLDGKHTVAYPEVAYYSLEEATATEGATLSGKDSTIVLRYATKGFTGVKTLTEEATTLENGHDYVFLDACTDEHRVGYRRIMPDSKRINRLFTADLLDPTAVWTLEGAGQKFKVKNEFYGLYVPTLQRSAAATASKTGGTFTFSKGTDDVWRIVGTNGMKWDGIQDGSLVGWDQGEGHPIRIFSFTPQPFFTLEINCRTEGGKVLSSSSQLLAAGEKMALTLPTFEGYVLKSTTGNEGFTGVMDDFYTVEAIYAPISEGITSPTLSPDNASSRSIYDLQGRRLRGISHPGIYIVNGKKTIVK